MRPMLVQGKEVAGILAAVSNIEADLVCVGASGTSRPVGIVFGSLATAMLTTRPARSWSREPTRIFRGSSCTPTTASPSPLRRRGSPPAAIRAALVTLCVGEGHGKGVSQQAAAIIEVTGVERC